MNWVSAFFVPNMNHAQRSTLNAQRGARGAQRQAPMFYPLFAHLYKPSSRGDCGDTQDAHIAIA